MRPVAAHLPLIQGMKVLHNLISGVFAFMVIMDTMIIVSITIISNIYNYQLNQ